MKCSIHTSAAFLNLAINCLIVFESLAQPAATSTPLPAVVASPIPSPDFNNAPTFIAADKLTLHSESRIFEYSGNVTVKRADVTMIADRLRGDYTDKNQIKTIDALGSVKLEKAPNIKAYGERAHYDALKNIVVLTENPAVEQDGSLLTADVITVYLDQNRSEASGDVRMKLLKKGDAGGSVEKLLKPNKKTLQ